MSLIFIICTYIWCFIHNHLIFRQQKSPDPDCNVPVGEEGIIDLLISYINDVKKKEKKIFVKGAKSPFPEACVQLFPKQINNMILILKLYYWFKSLIACVNEIVQQAVSTCYTEITNHEMAQLTNLNQVDSSTVVVNKGR